MDYQLVMELSRFLLFQLGVFALLMLTVFRAQMAFKGDINGDYQRILKDYRLTGILSYYELTQVFGDYSWFSLMRLISNRSTKGILEQSLCTHIYKAQNLHERDLKLMECFPFIKAFVLKRMANLNLKVSDFKIIDRDLEEMLILKERILDESVSVENTLVILNEIKEKVYLPKVLNLLSREKMSLLVFSYEKIQSLKVQKIFTEIAFRKLPFLNSYLVDSMVGSKHLTIKTRGLRYRLNNTLGGNSKSLNNVAYVREF